LPLDRELTRSKLGFATVHAPVTAVQLARGKAEAQLLFECTLLMQDLGRLAADLLLFYTQEFAFVTLPDSFTRYSCVGLSFEVAASYPPPWTTKLPTTRWISVLV